MKNTAQKSSEQQKAKQGAYNGRPSPEGQYHQKLQRHYPS
jgi:hypothetical protein